MKETVFMYMASFAMATMGLLMLFIIVDVVRGWFR